MFQTKSTKLSFAGCLIVALLSAQSSSRVVAQEDGTTWFDTSELFPELSGDRFRLEQAQVINAFADGKGDNNYRIVLRTPYLSFLTFETRSKSYWELTPIARKQADLATPLVQTPDSQYHGRRTYPIGDTSPPTLMGLGKSGRLSPYMTVFVPQADGFRMISWTSEFPGATALIAMDRQLKLTGVVTTMNGRPSITTLHWPELKDCWVSSQCALFHDNNAKKSFFLMDLSNGQITRWSQSLSTIQINSEKAKRHIPLSNPPRIISLHESGISLFDGRQKVVDSPYGHRFNPDSASLSADGKLLATILQSKIGMELFVFDTSDLRLVAKSKIENSFADIGWAGRHVLLFDTLGYTEIARSSMDILSLDNGKLIAAGRVSDNMKPIMGANSWGISDDQKFVFFVSREPEQRNDNNKWKLGRLSVNDLIQSASVDDGR